MQPKSRRAAWLQGIVLIGGTAALATTLAVRLHRPFDRDTLPLPVQELQSQAAEAGQLEQQARRDHLAPAFVRFHAQQLAHSVGRVRDDLAGKPARAGLEPLRRDALSLASDLQARIDRLGRSGALPRTASPGFESTAQALDALAKRIKPEG